MRSAYELAANNSEKSSAKGKRLYDKTVRGVVLQAGDRVLVKNLSERGRPGKLRAYWEQVVYRVVERVDDGPVYKVQPERGPKRLRVLHRNLLLPVNELPLEETLPVQCQKEKTQLKKQKKTATNTHEENTDSSDEEYTYQQIPCYRLVKPQQTERNQTRHHLQTEQRLSARACEFHPAVRQETDTEDKGEIIPPAQDGALEDVVVEEDGHQVEAESVRRSQRTARPREMFTYGTLGQPSYQQWNAGVHSLLPSHPLPSQLGAVPLTYFTPPHPYCYNCFTQAC